MSPQQAPADAEGTLLARVRDLLAATQKTNLDIYRDTGLQPSWLDTVRRGTTRNPSVNRIQHLYEYLSGKKLAIA
jgi:hypothetical protein